MFQQGLTDTLSATEIRQSIDQTQERTKRSTAGSSAHGFSCSRRLSPLSGRNSTYRLVQISGTGSIIILAERRKARQERRATNVMAMPFALMAAYVAFGAATYAAIVEASQQSYKR